MYKVVMVSAGCGQDLLNVQQIEETTNKMAAAGYELAHIYESSTRGCCVGTKTAAVLVFKHR
jgi:hypothetical protein